MKTDPRGLIAEVIEACPRRVATSESEARAVGIFEDAFRAIEGITTTRHDFKFNKSLYANLVLHFGLAVVASGIALFWDARIAAVLHFAVFLSYWLDTNKYALVLRRLFPFRPAQNLLATLPASGEVKRRIVMIGHADAAYTGLLFHPGLLKVATKEPPISFLRWTKRSVLLALVSVAILFVLTF